MFIEHPKNPTNKKTKQSLETKYRKQIHRYSNLPKNINTWLTLTKTDHHQNTSRTTEHSPETLNNYSENSTKKNFCGTWPLTRKTNKTVTYNRSRDQPKKPTEKLKLDKPPIFSCSITCDYSRPSKPWNNESSSSTLQKTRSSWIILAKKKYLAEIVGTILRVTLSAWIGIGCRYYDCI